MNTPSPHSFCNQLNELNADYSELVHNEQRTLWVVILTFTMMVIEIFMGYVSGSMALLADGYHMGSHVGALGIAYGVYRLSRSKKMAGLMNFGTGKLIPLGGFTSALGLGAMALWMIIESIMRFREPRAIEFDEALWVAGIGFVVNIVCAFILGYKHDHDHGHDHGYDHSHDHGHDHGYDHGYDHSHDHGHGYNQEQTEKTERIINKEYAKGKDHNHQGALAHVIADAFTSVAAIVALLIGKNYGLLWVDALVGILGGIVIIRWALDLGRVSAWELLDAYPLGISLPAVKARIEEDGHIVWDLHVWRSGPHHLVCLLTVTQANNWQKESHESDFRAYFKGMARGVHLVVEKKN